MPTNDNVKRVLQAIAYLMAMVDIAVNAIGTDDDDEARVNIYHANGALMATIEGELDKGSELYSEFYNLHSVTHAIMRAQINTNNHVQDAEVKRNLMRANYQMILDGCALSIAINS